MSIPEVINKVYLENSGKIPNILDINIKNSHNSWLEKNPGYNIKYWSLDDCRKYLKDTFEPIYLETFDCINAYGGKTNFFRYCIIYNEGGWYSDWKQTCLKENLLNIIGNGKKFVASWDKGILYTKKHNCIQNAIIGAIPKSNILKNAIDLCIEHVKNKYYGNHALDTTGVCVLNKAYFKEKMLNPSIENDVFFMTFKHDHKLVFIKNRSYFYINDEKVIQHKCEKCVQSQNWEKGNNYSDIWNNRTYYCNDDSKKEPFVTHTVEQFYYNISYDNKLYIIIAILIAMFILKKCVK